MGILGMIAVPGVHGQATTELLTTQLPFPAYAPVQDDHYLLRWGRLGMNLNASMEVMWTDNASLNGGGPGEVGEFTIGPLITAGFFLPVSEYEKLQMDVGVGYNYYSQRESRFRLNLVPNSHLHYGFRTGEVQWMFSDRSSTVSDPGSRLDVRGTGGKAVDFNQFSNVAAVDGTYGVSARWQLSTGYSYRLERSMTRSFQQLDQDTHTFHAGSSWKVSYPVTVGLRTSYSIFDFQQRIQNSGTSINIGPTMNWRPTDAWTIDLSVGYSISQFDRTGSINDGSDFSAPVFGVDVAYRMNRRMSHQLSFSRASQSSLGANFNDTYSSAYRLSMTLGPKISPYLGVSYDDFKASSSGGLSGTLIGVSMGVGYPIGRRLSSGLQYMHTIRSSDGGLFDYTANRVSLSINYRF